MLLKGLGIGIDLPGRWDGRIFQLPNTGPTLHAGNFAVPQDINGFGTVATQAMRPGNIFLAIVEYPDILPQASGPYSTQGPPRIPLNSSYFSPNLQAGQLRPGFAGLETTFYEGTRCFVLYSLLYREPTVEDQSIQELQAVIGSIDIDTTFKPVVAQMA